MAIDVMGKARQLMGRSAGDSPEAVADAIERRWLGRRRDLLAAARGGEVLAHRERTARAVLAATPPSELALLELIILDVGLDKEPWKEQARVVLTDHAAELEFIDERTELALLLLTQRPAGSVTFTRPDNWMIELDTSVVNIPDIANRVLDLMRASRERRRQSAAAAAGLARDELEAREDATRVRDRLRASGDLWQRAVAGDVAARDWIDGELGHTPRWITVFRDVRHLTGTLGLLHAMMAQEGGRG